MDENENQYQKPQPEQPIEVGSSWKKQFTAVTSFSKYLALALLVILLFAGLTVLVNKNYYEGELSQRYFESNYSSENGSRALLSRYDEKNSNIIFSWFEIDPRAFSQDQDSFDMQLYTNTPKEIKFGELDNIYGVIRFIKWDVTDGLNRFKSIVFFIEDNKFVLINNLQQEEYSKDDPKFWADTTDTWYAQFGNNIFYLYGSEAYKVNIKEEEIDRRTDLFSNNLGTWYLKGSNKIYKVEKLNVKEVTGLEDVLGLGPYADLYSNLKGDWYLNLHKEQNDSYKIEGSVATKVQGIRENGVETSFYSDEDGNWVARWLKCYDALSCIFQKMKIYYYVDGIESQQIKDFSGTSLCYKDDSTTNIRAYSSGETTVDEEGCYSVN